MCIPQCNLGIEFPFFTVCIVKYHDLIGLTRKISAVDLLSILLIGYFVQALIQIQFPAIGGKGFINAGVKANKAPAATATERPRPAIRAIPAVAAAPSKTKGI